MILYNVSLGFYIFVAIYEFSLGEPRQECRFVKTGDMCEPTTESALGPNDRSPLIRVICRGRFSCSTKLCRAFVRWEVVFDTQAVEQERFDGKALSNGHLTKGRKHESRSRSFESA